MGHWRELEAVRRRPSLLSSPVTDVHSAWRKTKGTLTSASHVSPPNCLRYRRKQSDLVVGFALMNVPNCHHRIRAICCQILIVAGQHQGRSHLWEKEVARDVSGTWFSRP